MIRSPYLSDIASQVGALLPAPIPPARLLTATQQLLSAGLRDPALIAARIAGGFTT